MAQDKRFLQKGIVQLAESPAPLAPEPEREAWDDSGHPGLRPSLVNIPVTPGIHLGAYETSDSSAGGGRPTTSYFHDISKLREAMAQSPTEAASGAKSNHDILRRMSLTGSKQLREFLSEIDPRAANSALGLSGGMISATFCIPHSLQYRKGQGWVGHFNNHNNELLTSL